MLNRNWHRVNSLPFFHESNFGESNTMPGLSQKSMQKYQHQEDCGAANSRDCN
jgi:hypothetical protein